MLCANNDFIQFANEIRMTRQNANFLITVNNYEIK